VSPTGWVPESGRRHLGELPCDRTGAAESKRGSSIRKLGQPRLLARYTGCNLCIAQGEWVDPVFVPRATEHVLRAGQVLAVSRMSWIGYTRADLGEAVRIPRSDERVHGDRLVEVDDAVVHVQRLTCSAREVLLGAG
jgi:hypothetical protein